MGVNYSRSEQATNAHCSTVPDTIPDENVPKTSEGEKMDGDGNTRENESEDEFFETRADPETSRSSSQELIEFRKELAIKRDKRKQIIAKHTMEKDNLRKALEAQIKSNLEIISENKHLRELLEHHEISVPDRETNTGQINELHGPLTFLADNYEELKETNKCLRRDITETNLSLQSANSDIANLQGQNIEAMKQISALKEVVAVTKTMMRIRESQLNELKEKLSEIETSLADREASLLSTDLRAEYERQLQNIRSLRTLYEERARLAEVTRQQLLREVEEQKDLTAVETNRCKELADKVAELEAKIVDMNDTIDNKDDQISVTTQETRGLKAEMTTVNKLFSQMLLGHKSQQDLDKLVTRLEEHHGLLTHMVVQDNGSEASSALPKLLLDLVSQVDNPEDKEADWKNNIAKTSKTVEEGGLSTTAEEIVGNLPKVWRVLMEFLSHQSGTIEVSNNQASSSTCYKSVETSSGPRLVPSVSQTYIRLKDLIVEKLSLTKEMNKMKQLNVHLETRLEEQERRLCLVTSELSKTWHVVGRLRRHHHQLHTHEKILRYELQQKRKMLNELKEELEYCRDKWDKARVKNCESEKEWNNLRNEFSSRKAQDNASVNNSAESGYSDERQTEDESTESNDESEYLNELHIRCKKRIRKTIDAVVDSSTDANLIAEGEDPISDMLDVSELPLDGIDTEEHVERINNYTNEHVHDLLTSESNMSEISPKSVHSIASNTSAKSTEILLESNVLESINPIIDHKRDHTDNKYGNMIATTSELHVQNTPQEILENVRRQNERLAKKEERLQMLEDSSASLLNQVTKNAELRQNISDRLKILRERTSIEASTSIKSNENDLPYDENVNDKTWENLDEVVTKISSNSNEPDVIMKVKDESPNKSETNENVTQKNNAVSSSELIDPSEIRENLRKQNDRLLKREQRMKDLENGCKSLLSTTTKTLLKCNNLEQRLDILHTGNSQNSDEENCVSNTTIASTLVEDNSDYDRTKIPDPVDSSDLSQITAISSEPNNEPSTSTTIMDHEARFAARDERLKRLEEQTKSLVNKVNDTTTKSVKISYKLQELHNIYGSEGGTSRNNTPDEDESGNRNEEGSNNDSDEEA